MDPDQSDLGPHCLPVCKNRFEKFARIFSRRHKQTTFSDAVFLGALRVNGVSTLFYPLIQYSIFEYPNQMIKWQEKCRLNLLKEVKMKDYMYSYRAVNF